MRDCACEQDADHQQSRGDRPKNEDARRVHRTGWLPFALAGGAWPEGRALPPEADLAPGAGFSPWKCTLTLLPSCSLSTPVITTTSPGSRPAVTSESSPSVVPMVTGRTVTVESGFTR